MAEVKMSLKVARDRLIVFGADRGGGTGAPPRSSDEAAILPFLGLPSPGDLLCFDCFFLSLRGFSSCSWGCEEMLSTSSDGPLTSHQLLGRFLLRFSVSPAQSCSLGPLEETGAAVLDVFSVEV